jgi:predicted amidohydrolase
VGGSVVASPLGEVIEAAGADPTLLVTDIDPDAVQSVRDTIAVLRNRTDLAELHKAESRG